MATRFISGILFALALVALGANAQRLMGAAATQPSTTQPVNTPTGLPDGSNGGIDSLGGISGLAPGGNDLAPELDLFKDIPVVVAAAKHEQTIDQAPASVSVVTADDIKYYGYENLADALRNQRSMYIVSDGLNELAGVRGFTRANDYNSSLAILVDGRPTNELLYGQSHLDTNFDVPMEAIKQIEIIRGPGSALYGTNAEYGVVNVVTKDGSDINGVEASVMGGTLDTVQSNILAGGVVGGWDIAADFNGFSSQGDRHVHLDGVNSPTLNFGNIDDQDYSGNYAGFIKARYGEFTAELDLERRQQDNEYATYNPSFFDTGVIHEQRDNITLKWDHELSQDQSLHAMGYYSHYSYQQPIPEATDATGLPTEVYTTTSFEDWIGADINYDLVANKNFQLIVGADGTQSLDTRQHDYDTASGDVLNVPASYTAWALYGQAEYDVNDHLSLTAGARVDEIQRVGASLSPRFAIVGTPTKSDTLKVLYGRAFRDPTLYDLLYTDPGANTANPDLKPEVVDTYELVWQKRYADNWSTTLDGYYWVLQRANGNVLLGDGSIQTQNVGTYNAKGLEAEVDKSWSKHGQFRLYGSYDWTDAAGMLPPQSPKWMVGTALAVPIYRPNTVLSIEPQFVGPMASGGVGFTQPTYLTNIVFTTDDLVRDWTFQAGVYNLFSKGARLPGGGPTEQVGNTLPYPGTEFRLNITHRF